MKEAIEEERKKRVQTFIFARNLLVTLPKKIIFKNFFLKKGSSNLGI